MESSRSGRGAPAPPGAPPRGVRIMGHAISSAVTRAPFLWPLLRRPIRSFWNGMAGEWDARDRGSPSHLAPLAAALTHVRPAPERALDIGTGTGTGALLVAREFPQARVRGVDLSPEMVRLAQGKIGLDPEGRVAFRVGDASELPWGDDSFDLVTQLNMPPFFGEIARVLRPGGHVAVAATYGPATPYYTPEPVLRRGFARHGLEPVQSGGAGDGTFFVARLTA